ncbi:MAG: amidohydrolase family protein, partial [Rubrobacter sp.]
MKIGSDEHLRLLSVARGELPPDLLIKGGTVANVYSGEFLAGNVAVVGDSIAYVGKREIEPGPETTVVDATNKYVTPGYIEAHNHPWAMYNPVSLAGKVLPLGATTVVADTLFFQMQLGLDGLERMLDDLRDLPLHYLWVARLISQSRFESEREMFPIEGVRRLLDRDDVVGTAEVTRWMDLAAGDADVLAGIAAARERGKISDGHTGGASENRLPALVAAGIDADHEAITKEELLHRLRLGLWTMMRHSSLRPDLPELRRAVTEDGINPSRLIMTTDGASPEYLARDGFVDGMLRIAVGEGLQPMTALQMVTVNPATWLGLDRDIGGVAPGRRAGILVLPDLESFVPETVISSGRVVAKNGELLAGMPDLDWSDYGSEPRFSAKLPLEDSTFFTPTGEILDLPIMDFKTTVITAGGEAVKAGDEPLEPGLLHSALLDREGEYVSRAFVRNFATDLDGFASTYNTTTELLVVGRDAASMA